MKTRAALACGVLLAAVAAGPAKPPSVEEGARIARLRVELPKALDAEATAADKLARLMRHMGAEPSAQGRQEVVKVAERPPGPERDRFLIDVMIDDPDAGIRGLAATDLGRIGSEKCLPALVRAAGFDPTTDCHRGGCIVYQTSARRSATFAVAALAARFPKLNDEAAAGLRALAPAAGPDGEGLIDARLQALYQVTRDEALVKPFYERLKSRDAKERADGVVAFRFLGLKSAPAELVAALKDDDRDVRSWAALVLGEIGDAKTVPVLLALAVDPKGDVGQRCSAIGSLGRMKADVAGPLRKLLADDNQSVQVSAAIALFAVTGEKARQFPAGYGGN